MRLWTASIGLALLAGCGPAVDRLWASPPPRTGGARSVLFALEAVDQPVLFAAAAIEGQPSEALSFDVPGADAVGGESLLAYAYPYDLDGLGLSPGRLAPGIATTCRLEAPMSAFRTVVPGAAWAPADRALPGSVRRALFGERACVPDRACADFDVERIEVPGATQMRALTALDDRLLLVDARGRFYTVTATGATRRADLEHLPARSVGPAADGGLWFGGRQGRLLHGPLEGPYADVSIDTATGAVAGVADSPEHGLLALTITPEEERGDEVVEVHLRRGGVWSRLFRTTTPRGYWWESDLAWTPDGQGLIVFGGARILRFDGARVHELDLGRFDLVEQVASAALVTPEGRAYVGGHSGSVLTAEPPYTSWARLDARPVPNTIQALAPYRSGFLVGGRNGFIGEHVPGGRPCPSRSYHEAGSHLVAPLGQDVFVAGGGANDLGEGYVIHLRPGDG